MNEIPAEVLEALAVEEEFADAADEYVEIAFQMREQRKAELREAQDALERADEGLERAWRAQKLAHDKRLSLLRAEGLVRTADGYQLVKTP